MESGNVASVLSMQQTPPIIAIKPIINRNITTPRLLTDIKQHFSLCLHQIPFQQPLHIPIQLIPLISEQRLVLLDKVLNAVRVTLSQSHVLL